MFEKIKTRLNEEFAQPEAFEFDTILEEGVDQFPKPIPADAPDEQRDIDGLSGSITDLDYSDEDDCGIDIDDEIDDVDVDDDSDITDLADIEEDEEEDDIAEEVINEALDDILLKEEDEVDVEIDSLLEEVYELEEGCKAKKEECKTKKETCKKPVSEEDEMNGEELEESCSLNFILETAFLNEDDDISDDDMEEIEELEDEDEDEDDVDSLDEIL